MWPIIKKDWREGAANLLLAVIASLVLAVLAALLIEHFGLSRPERIMIVFLAMLPAGLGAVVGSDGLAREVSAGTLSILYTRPVARWRVWSAKWLAGASLSVAHVLAFWIVLLPMSAVWAGLIPEGLARNIWSHGAPPMLALACFAVAFAKATQLRRRFDALMAGLMASGVLLAIHPRVALDTIPFCLAALLLAIIPTLFALRADPLLETPRRALAAVTGGAVAIAVLIGISVGLHQIDRAGLRPTVEAIHGLQFIDSDQVLISARVAPGLAHPFGSNVWPFNQQPGSRVAAVNLTNRQVRWMPFRWATNLYWQSDHHRRRSLVGARTGTDVSPDSDASFLALDHVLGYPTTSLKKISYDLVSDRYTTSSWPPARQEVVNSSGVRFRLDGLDDAGSRRVWKLNRFEATGAAGATLHKEEGHGSPFIWPDGEGVALFVQRWGRSTLLRFAAGGEILDSADVPRPAASAGGGMVGGGMYVHKESLMLPDPADAGSSAEWSLILEAGQRGMLKTNVILAHPEGGKIRWTVLGDSAATSQAARRLPGSRWIVPLKSPDRESRRGPSIVVAGWDGELERKLSFTAGDRIRGWEVSPGGKSCLFWLRKGDGSHRRVLLDLKSFSLTALKLAGDDPPDGLSTSIVWLDDRRWVQYGPRDLYLFELTSRDGCSVRKALSL